MAKKKQAKKKSVKKKVAVKKSPKKKVKAIEEKNLEAMSVQELVKESVDFTTRGEQLINMGKFVMDMAQRKLADEKGATAQEVVEENQDAVKSILPENTQMSLGI